MKRAIWTGPHRVLFPPVRVSLNLNKTGITLKAVTVDLICLLKIDELFLLC
jgi:hypothetical protein